jgi:hypothetical protein
MNKDYRNGQQEVLIAIAEYLGNGGELNADNFEQFAQTYDRTEDNPYSRYSLDTLRELARQYSFLLGNGRTTIGNGEDLGQAYEFVLEAMEDREDTDHCKHGWFKYQEGLCHGCEME